MKRTDLDAVHYRNHSTTQYTLSHELLREVNFQGNETIVDVGCGDGRITAELAQFLPQGNLLGIDPSASMIDLASQSFSKEHYPNLEFKNISAEVMQIQHVADIVLLLNALHWIRNPWKALQNCTTALKPGGRLIILTYPKESPYWLFLEETVKEARWSPFQPFSAYKTMCTTQEYQSYLTKMGMQIDPCVREERIAVYPTAQDLKNYVKGWLGCYISDLGDQEESFLESALHHATHFSLSIKELQLPYVKLTIIAHKKV